MDTKLWSAKEFLRLYKGKLNAFMGVPLTEFTHEELSKICNFLAASEYNPMQLREDPYLQKGWPCEVWDYEDNKQLSYYFGTDGNVHRFNRVRNTGYTIFYGGRHYRPIGTEWDFAPDYCKTLVISSEGWCCFLDVAGSSQAMTMQTVLPLKYYGWRIQRPKWAGGCD